MPHINALVAFVLAGGLGTRLRSLVSDRPKPMAPINGIPFLEILIRSLGYKGVRRFVLLTGYMGAVIEDYFTGFDPQLDIQCVRETRPLGTGGAVKNAEVFASAATLLVNGDTFFDADLGALLAFHQRVGSQVTLSLHPVPDVSRYGSVLTDSADMVTGFMEKRQNAGPGLINAGFSVLTREFIESLPARPFSMEQEIFPIAAGSGVMAGLKQIRPFFDIGEPATYCAFERYVKENAGLFERKSPRQ